MFPSQVLVEDTTAPPNSNFYDRALAKWLPVDRSDVSPDGRRYASSKLAGNAYQNTGSTVYVVDVATGTTRAIYNGPNAYTVVDFESEGVYLTAAVPEGYPRGLWLQSLAGGQPRLISSSIESPTVAGGAAWGIDFNAADPSPGPGGLEGPRNRLLRYDLNTGIATPWFYRQGANIQMVGASGIGRPFVAAFLQPASGQAAFELWYVQSALDARKVLVDTTQSLSLWMAAVDRYGVWFENSYLQQGSSTIWLYQAGSLQVVATVNRDSVGVAGGCIP